MSIIRLSVAVVTKSQFENISESAAAKDALPKVISSKAISFRCKLNTTPEDTIQSVERKALSLYESVARVKAFSLGIFDNTFSYLQSDESVKFSAEPNNNLYLVLDKVVRQPAQRKRNETSSVNNSSMADASKSQQAQKTPSQEPEAKRRKQTVASPAAQSTPSKPHPDGNRAARRKAAFSRENTPDMPDLAAANSNGSSHPVGPSTVDETVQHQDSQKSLPKPSAATPKLAAKGAGESKPEATPVKNDVQSSTAGSPAGPVPNAVENSVNERTINERTTQAGDASDVKIADKQTAPVPPHPQAPKEEAPKKEDEDSSSDESTGDDSESEDEDEDEKRRRRQRAEKARMLSASRRSSSMEPQELPPKNPPVKAAPQSVEPKPKATPAPKPAADLSAQQAAEPEDPKSDDVDHVPGLGGFENLSKLDADVHDSKRPPAPKPAPTGYQSSDEESDDSSDSSDSDSESESDSDEEPQAKRAPRKKTLKHLYS